MELVRQRRLFWMPDRFIVLKDSIPAWRSKTLRELVLMHSDTTIRETFPGPLGFEKFPARMYRHDFGLGVYFFLYYMKFEEPGGVTVTMQNNPGKYCQDMGDLFTYSSSDTSFLSREFRALARFFYKESATRHGHTPGPPRTASTLTRPYREGYEKVTRTRSPMDGEAWAQLMGYHALRELNLGGNQLETLPDALGDFTFLEVLTLSANNLHNFPTCILRLTRLTKLQLSHNKLTSVPDAIRRLTALKVLRLNHNQLTTLPAALGDLVELETLRLESNFLGDTPIGTIVEGLSSLRELSMGNNKLTAAPMLRLSSLTDLDVGHGPARGDLQIGTVFARGMGVHRCVDTALVYLNRAIAEPTPLNLKWDACQVLEEIGHPAQTLTYKLPQRFVDMGCPGFLVSGEAIEIGAAGIQLLRSPPFEDFSFYFKHSTQVYDMGVHQFMFSRMFSVNGYLINILNEPKQYCIHMGDIFSKSAPPLTAEFRMIAAFFFDRSRENHRVYDLPYLQENMRRVAKEDTDLVLSGGSLVEVDKTIADSLGLLSVDLSNNQLKTLPEEFGAGAKTTLRSLNLETNQLPTVPPCILRLTALSRLNLCYNKLINIPDEIRELAGLKELQLSGNQLTKLPASLEALDQLQLLLLDDNRFTVLDSPLPASLEALDLQGNLLTYLPTCLKGLINLRHLYLRRNFLQGRTRVLRSLIALDRLYLGVNNLSNLSLSLTEQKLLEIDIGRGPVSGHLAIGTMFARGEGVPINVRAARASLNRAIAGGLGNDREKARKVLAEIETCIPTGRIQHDGRLKVMGGFGE